MGRGRRRKEREEEGGVEGYIRVRQGIAGWFGASEEEYVFAEEKGREGKRRKGKERRRE